MWSDNNLSHAFKRIFHFSIDLPRELYDEFKDLDIVDPKKAYGLRPKLRKEIRKLPINFYDWEKYQFKIEPHMLLDDWFLE